MHPFTINFGVVTNLKLIVLLLPAEYYDIPIWYRQQNPVLTFGTVLIH